uniref:Variant surface glycoprotein n=1 Tax=Trypanosoma brucei TaxID=5691 RepID=A0A1V0FYN7_9TRYP|nr:variant surface glycoprotein [Trypanosoma brucei]
MVNNVGYLGQTLDGSCTGSIATTGVCVKYTNTITNNKDEFTKLTFAALALEAADELEQRTDEEKQDSIKRTELDNTIKAAYALTHEAEALHKALQLLPGKASSPQTAEKVIAYKKQVCAKHKNNKKSCTEANYTWKERNREDKGECKDKKKDERKDV